MKADEYKAMVPTDYSWCEKVINEYGYDYIQSYMSRLTSILQKMKPGAKLNILDPQVVSEQNRELFVKIAWLLIITCKFPINFFYTDTEFYLKKSME